MADQAFVLETGKVIVSGTGQDLLDDPLVQKAYLECHATELIPRLVASRLMEKHEDSLEQRIPGAATGTRSMGSSAP